MTKASNIEPDDFIGRDDFIKWVLTPTPESDLYWRQFLAGNPSCQKQFDEAVFVVKNIIPDEKELNEEQLAELWNAIRERTVIRKTRKLFSVWSVAAGFLVVLGLSSIVYFQFNSSKNTVDYQSIAQRSGSSGEIKLIFADQTEKSFDTNNIRIEYKDDGGIEINSDSGENLTRLSDKNKKAGDQNGSKNSFSREERKELLNQLVVPRGKRTSLLLSDGSRLHLNSGSRAIFPVEFLNEKREVFVEGEAFFEVAHHCNKPFIVKTQDISVKVLGTKFDISTYREDQASVVVLVEGSIQAEVNSREIQLRPNQMLTYKHDTKSISLEETDVLPHISWKDGWLYCKKEKLGNVASKLSRYYDIQIEFKDKETSELILYGKLDLKSECSDIFRAISSIAPISCTISNDKIIVSKK
ncbi:FecR family protein [Gaoshiqia sp. Z1-71]|uniref:FecR family protein n=1 Tax=Gaoshiqia hydrogeniformans TaxID=3290090 RepID=UPI003BF88738